jgi:hypothetical protein
VHGSTYSNMSDENISHDRRYKYTEEHGKVQSVNDTRCVRGRTFVVPCYVAVHTFLTVLVHFDGTSHSTNITFE